MTTLNGNAAETAAELPADVKGAIHDNRRIDAIKLLREQRNLGLKEAKDIVEDYVRANRHLIGNQREGRESGIGRLLIIVFLAGIVYAAYRAFA